METKMKKVNKKKNPGLAKLPKTVRNKMGYMKNGGKAMKPKGMKMGGAASMKPKGMKNGGKAMKPKGMKNGGKTMKPKGMKSGGMGTSPAGAASRLVALQEGRKVIKGPYS